MMNKTFESILIIGFIALVGFVVGYNAKDDIIKTVEKEKIIVKYDTITVIKPVPRIVYKDKIIIDTLKIAGDTVFKMVEVPIEKRIYRDSTYYAEIEGFKPKLNKIEIYPRTVIKTADKEVIRKKRLTYGLQFGAGYGLMNKKPDIFIGAGLNYNF